MTNADHRAVFEIASGIWGNAGRLAVKVVEQLTFFSDDARMVPLIGINLHDDHTAWCRIALDESFPLPVFEIEIVRVLTFPPRVIDAKIVQRDALNGVPVHNQPPAVIRTQDKRTSDKRQRLRHYLGVFIAVR